MLVLDVLPVTLHHSTQLLPHHLWAEEEEKEGEKEEEQKETMHEPKKDRGSITYTREKRETKENDICFECTFKER